MASFSDGTAHFPKEQKLVAKGLGDGRVAQQELGLKVEWAEETGWGNYSEGLNTGRFDVMCSPPWASGFRARASLLTKPAIGSALYAVARADDNRFPDVESLNQKDVKIAVVDGDTTQSVRKMMFPFAQELTLSPMVDSATLILNVTGRKADVTLYDANNLATYNAHAADKIKIVAGGKPIRVFDCVYAVRLGETDLKNALDAAISALTKSGITQQIVNKYPGIAMPDGN